MGKGFSNFLFVDQHYGANPVLRRIFSQARKHKYESLSIEEISEGDCAQLAAENKALAIRRSDFQRSEVHRISFFRCPANTAPSQSDFVGYVVFKTDFFSGSQRAHVFESVTPLFRQVDQNNYVSCQRRYEVNTTLGKFGVTGVLYAQQNDATFVCAHVGLRTVLATILSEGDITYERLNALAGVDHSTRQVGGGRGGLTPGEIEGIFAGLGLFFEKVVHEPSQELILPTEYQRDLYGFIESGSPALVGFELDDPTAGPGGGPRHVIPIFGHTFNEDTWLPQAQRAYFGGSLSYYPSENWLSTFVGHDDNFGPYLCLPRHFLKKDNFRLLYGLKPCATTFNAVQAEAIGFGWCNVIAKNRPRAGNDWYDRFSVFTQRGWLVLRTMLVNKAQYLKHLEGMRTWDGMALESDMVQKFRDFLPGTFWMVEASAPELFNSSRRKFGEILLPCDRPPTPLSVSLLLAARLPGLIYFRPGQLQLEVRPTQLRAHTGLFSLYGI